MSEMNDPGRSDSDDDVIVPNGGRDRPVIPVSDDSSSGGDDDDEGPHPDGGGGGGYVALPQEPPLLNQDDEDSEEDDEEEGSGDVTNDATTIQLPDDDVTGVTRNAGANSELFQDAERQRRREEAEERLRVFNAPIPTSPGDGGSDVTRDIALNDEKLAQIKSAMSGIKLTSVPPWAKEMSDQDWQVVQKKVVDKK